MGGTRTAMAVEIALAIPPGKTRVSKGILGPLAERYGVGPGYPKKHWSECKAQINETGELDLSNKRHSNPPSILEKMRRRWGRIGHFFTPPTLGPSGKYI